VAVPPVESIRADPGIFKWGPNERLRAMGFPGWDRGAKSW